MKQKMYKRSAATIFVLFVLGLIAFMCAIKGSAKDVNRWIGDYTITTYSNGVDNSNGMVTVKYGSKLSKKQVNHLKELDKKKKTNYSKAIFTGDDSKTVRVWDDKSSSFYVFTNGENKSDGYSKVKYGTKLSYKQYKHLLDLGSYYKNNINVTTADKYYKYKQKVSFNKKSTKNTSSNGSYVYSPSYFKRMGVINWGGHRFTWYSEKVLPGGGLKIPGRHVNKNGYVCDVNGYICCAADPKYPKGTVFNTPFGAKAKVYDRGVYGNSIDIYVSW